MTTVRQVFVVDDEEAICQAFEFLLQPRGFLVRTFTSAKLFLEHYCDHWQGCLFTDVQMPEMSGTDLFDELRAKRCSLTIILMTANENIETLRRSLSETVLILEKPFSGQALLQFIEQHFGN